jgi:dethiobiotin synthase
VGVDRRSLCKLSRPLPDGGRAYVVTATGTGVGKTLTSAILTLGLDACYWKPVQSGAGEGTDTDAVCAMTGAPAERFLPEAYVFQAPLSPHRAAELEGSVIDPDSLCPPSVERPLIIEGAGGLLVPLNRNTLFADVFARWGLPVILCARTELGAINQALLSIEAIRARGLTLHGVVYLGEDSPDTIRTVAEFSQARTLAHIPSLADITPDALREAFAKHFSRQDFAS